VIVLGFDTSTSSTAVALRGADGSTVSARDDPPPGSHPGHATRLLALADELLARACVGWSDVERIAVGVGPGTFTGLRVGVATARGLAQSLSVELVAVSSLQALAAAALADGRVAAPDAVGGQGAALPSGAGTSAADTAALATIDARRGEVYAAAYAIAGEGESEAESKGGAPRELVGAAALPPQALPGVLARAQQLARPGASWSWLAVGDGALRYREQIESAGIFVPDDRSPLQLVNGAWICELGALGTPSRLHDIGPDYRRRPDAELALVAARRATSPVS
jgi:tRNA threonylcarbamoyladenosine biosynthesis protein TsaB